MVHRVNPAPDSPGNHHIVDLGDDPPQDPAPPNPALVAVGGAVAVEVQSADSGGEEFQGFFSELRTMYREVADLVRSNVRHNMPSRRTLVAIGVAGFGVVLARTGWAMVGSLQTALGQQSSPVNQDRNGLIFPNQVRWRARNAYEGLTATQVEAVTARLVAEPDYPYTPNDIPDWAQEFEESCSAEVSDLLREEQRQLSVLEGLYQLDVRSAREVGTKEMMRFYMQTIEHINANAQQSGTWSDDFKECADKLTRKAQSQIREMMASAPGAPASSNLVDWLQDFKMRHAKEISWLEMGDQNVLYGIGKSWSEKGSGKGGVNDAQLTYIKAISRELQGQEMQPEWTQFSQKLKELVQIMVKEAESYSKASRATTARAQPQASSSGMQPSPVTPSTTTPTVTQTSTPPTTHSPQTPTPQTPTPSKPGGKHTSKTNDPNRNDGS